MLLKGAEDIMVKMVEGEEPSGTSIQKVIKVEAIPPGDVEVLVPPI